MLYRLSFLVSALSSQEPSWVPGPGKSTAAALRMGRPPRLLYTCADPALIRRPARALPRARIQDAVPSARLPPPQPRCPGCGTSAPKVPPQLPAPRGGRVSPSARIWPPARIPARRLASNLSVMQLGLHPSLTSTAPQPSISIPRTGSQAAGQPGSRAAGQPI